MTGKLLPDRIRDWAAARLGLPLLVIVLAGLLVYSNNYQGEFIFDDFPAIVDNSAVKDLASIRPLLRPVPDGGPLAGRPVVALSMALNYAIGGLEVWGYHLVNNLIHIMAALTLFGLVRSTLLLPCFAGRFGDKANCYGLAVALLWMLHPLQTEAVNYITQRTEMLVGLFYLLTIFCAVNAFRSTRPQRWYTASVTACALGMASKEVMASAPLLVLLYDRLFAAGSFAGALRQRRGYYAALAGTWLVVGFYQLDNPRADSVLYDQIGLSVLDYFRTQMTIVVHYLRLSLWPTPLVLDSQDWPIAREFSVPLVATLLAVAGFCWGTVWGTLRGKWWSILGAWFICILAPSSSFIPIVTEIVAERRMYLPLAAVVVLAVFCAESLLRRIAVLFNMPGNAVKVSLSLALALILVVFSNITYARNAQYRTAVSIWTDSVAKRPGNSRAQENLGKALMVEGRYAEALPHFREAIRLFPEYQPRTDLAEIHSSLGACLSQLGMVRESMQMFRVSVELNPEDNLNYYLLGNAYLRLNDRKNASQAFARSIDLDPAFPPAHGNLGLILMEEGNLAGAEAHFRTLLHLSPLEVNSYLLLVDLLAKQGRFGEAAGLCRLGIARGVGIGDLSAALGRLSASLPEAGRL